MKKVHYTLGAAALAPAAFGLLAPAAHAGTAHASGPARQGTGKTVALQRGNVTAATYCDGSKHTSKSNSRFSINYWYTPAGDSTCVGTVIGKNFLGAKWAEDVYVYYNGGKKATYPCGVHAFSCTVGVHAYFPDLSRVCAHWWGGRSFSVDEGGICRDPISG